MNCVQWIVTPFIRVWLVMGLFIRISTSENQVVCSHEEVNIQCVGTDIIMIQNALYGRMERNMECIQTPLPLVPSVGMRCDGSPLEVPYTEGYLSTAIAKHAEFGTRKCPWKLKVKSGQTINITILNFNRTRRGGHSGSTPCHTYGEVSDEVQTKRLSVCASDPRFEPIFQSTTSKVLVKFSTGLAEDADALIKFEANGCSDLVQQPGHHVSRNGDKAEIRCSRDDGNFETLYLTCKGTEWLGQKNCSFSVIDNGLDNMYGASDGSFPYGLVIVVAIGVALGIFLGGILLLCASVYMKRKHENNGEYSRPEYDIEYNTPGENCTYPHIIHNTPICAPRNRDTLVSNTNTICAKHGMITTDSPDHFTIGGPMHGTQLAGQIHNVPYKTAEKPNVPIARDHFYEHPQP